MGTFASGFESGKRTGAPNPITALLKAGRESFARRLAEDKRRRSEERTLLNTLLRLGMKHEFDRALQGESKRKKSFKTPLEALRRRN